MKAVNLLPEQHRPRVATGSKAGSAYVVIGVLAVLLLGVVAYVVTANRVTDRREQAVAAERDVRESEAKLAGLGAYGDFAQIAATRKASVTALAQLRFDWERFLRETAHVLPRSTWLTAVDASLKPESTNGAAPVAAGAAEAVKPAASLEGCARRQSDVATVMVRLRKLHRVDDVTLDESSKAEGAAAPSSEGTGDGCGRFYQFKVKAVFEAATPADALPSGKPAGVPASLGGGS